MSVFIDTLLPLGLAFIMLSLGLGLTGADFTRIARSPRAVLAGLAAQMAMLPLVVFVLLQGVPLDPKMAVGVMILALSPGGVVTNLLTRMAHGDVALSVTLTAVVSLAAIVTLPPLVALSSNWFMGQSAPPVAVGALVFRIVLVTTIPILVGMGMRAVLPGPVRRIEPAVNRLAGLVFAGIIVAAVALNLDVVLLELPQLGPLAVAMMAGLLALGFLGGRLVGLGPAQARSIAIETSVQNGTVGLLVGGIVAGTTSEVSGFILPSVVYGVLTYVVVVPLVLIIWRRPPMGVSRR